jgi:hypothetical protein
MFLVNIDLEVTIAKLYDKSEDNIQTGVFILNLVTNL